MKKSEDNINFNWPLIGNEHVTHFLSRSIINEKLVNTYIFLGPSNLGKTTLANYFSKILLCGSNERSNLPCGGCSSCQGFDKKVKTDVISEDSERIAHGDFHLIKKDKDKKNISIEQVREFIGKLNLSSFLGSYKIGIIKNADSLSNEAANALLKTLEEPKEKVVIILIASSMESLPMTISSRSQVVNFYPVKTDIIYDYLIKEHKTLRSAAKNLSHLSLGRPALAIKFLEDTDFYNSYLVKANLFLDIFNQDISKRFESVASLIGAKASGQESAKRASWIIETWKGLIRDLLLLDLGHNNLIQHEVIGREIEKFRNKFNKNNLVNMIKVFEKGETYLRANVNPKLVLENIVINI